MIGGMLGRINTAEQMTVEQLQQALDSGSLPAYIGVPILQEKMQMRDRATALSYGQQLASQPPIMEEIMNRARSSPNAADMVQGIDQLPTPIRPEAAMAAGGIVALADGGYLRGQRRPGLVEWLRENWGDVTKYSPAVRLMDDASQRREYRAGRTRDNELYSDMPEDLKASMEELDRHDAIKRWTDAPSGVDTFAIDPPRDTTLEEPYFYTDASRKRAQAAARARRAQDGGQDDSGGIDVLSRIKGWFGPDAPKERSPSVDIPPEVRAGLDAVDAGTAGEVEARRAQSIKSNKTVPPEPVTGTASGASRGSPRDGIAALPTRLEPTPLGEATPTAAPEQPRSAMDEYIDLLMKDREAATAERGDAKNMALIQAGLGMMAGRSPYALQNIGAGGAAGLQYYNEATRDISNREREALMGALGARVQQERMASDRDYKEALIEIQKAGLGLKERQLGIMAQKAAASAASAGIKAKDFATVQQRFFKMLVDNDMPDLDDAAVMQQYSNRATRLAMQAFLQSGGDSMSAPEPERVDMSGIEWPDD